ncbi:hydroxymethylbilane synthase [Lutibacter sp. B1]|uniref:hydroxymethylbilane synthase n=1 Tax=Lutibacter sp. B1 TaxID=2725996 RepID=UPI0014568B0D|nr:hydroxymethylbilane synthase [Lutibacter sp. B1]NLP56779.1 hydroxymethylbilane synthase [Lutibacter sp. B1]
MKTIRIGTRSSQLALWQANTVSHKLEQLGYTTEIVKIDSIGDVVLDKPLYELGVTGVFTKNLDIALLSDKIDIAVHSFKDVPTKLPNGIVQAAVLKRGDFNDVLILKKDENFFTKETAVIATGSLRRKAQWLYRYPNHTISGLRGNVNTRLQKLEDNNWDGAIFASAGLKRLGLLPQKEDFIKLDWMIPAPAQGAVMVAALEKREELLEICKEINHEETAKCIAIEREFLRVLEGGCTAPIGALATIKDEEIKFKGVLFSPDGTNKIEFSKSVPVNNASDLGEFAAKFILDRGGEKLMRQEIKIEKDILVYSTKTLSQDQTSELSSKIGISMSDFITVRSNRLKPKVVKNTLQNVIFTSQNSVEALLHNFSALELDFKTIYCVGRRTKKLIEKRIGKVAHIENSAEKLAKYLVKNLKEKEITFFCGDKRRDELPDILSKNYIKVNEVECYKTTLTPKKIQEKYNGILFYSPTGIESFLKENKAGSDIVVFCIGETTATEAKKYFKNVKVSKLQTVESVIKSVNQYFEHE